MSQGYYDPHPLMTLDRPLVLIGHPGAGIDQVGRMLAGRTGLAFNDVERSAESSAGSSRSRILLESGLKTLRETEARALARAIRRRPCGVVVMESGLVEDAETFAWLTEQAALVYVRRDEERLLARIRQQLEDAPGSLPEFLMGAPPDVEALRGHLRTRDEKLSEISVIVEARDEHPSRISGQILASLDDLLGVERIGAAR